MTVRWLAQVGNESGSLRLFRLRVAESLVRRWLDFPMTPQTDLDLGGVRGWFGALSINGGPKPAWCRCLAARDTYGSAVCCRSADQGSEAHRRAPKGRSISLCINEINIFVCIASPTHSPATDGSTCLPRLVANLQSGRSPP